jgi:vitamin B12 transporter
VLKGGTGLDLRAGWKVSPTGEVYLAADNALGADLAVGQTADGVTSYSAPRTIYIGFALRR